MLICDLLSSSRLILVKQWEGKMTVADIYRRLDLFVEVEGEWGQFGREGRMFSLDGLFYSIPYFISCMVHHSMCHFLI